MDSADEKDGPARTGLEVSLICYWWWQPLFRLCTPRIRIDGTEQLLRWGRNFIAASPGEHDVHISFPYMGKKECCPADASVTVREGAVVKLEYKPPFSILQRGRIRIR